MIRSLLVLGLLTLAFSACNSETINPENTTEPTEMDYRADGQPSVEGPDAAPGANMN
ncbi:MAG: hypothetical protein AAB802_00065 [Patescibacteria group bacterium]